MSDPTEFNLFSPFDGQAVPLDAVPDPAFSERMLGDGIGINPSVGRLVAPCDGKVTHLARTEHSVTLTTSEGAEVLLHIGIDTVELGGVGFRAQAQIGDVVRLGDLLVEFDHAYVKEHASSAMSVMAITNGELFEIVTKVEDRAVTAGQTPVMRLRAKEDTVIPEDPENGLARVSVTLQQPGGLHARPAARVRQASKAFSASTELWHAGKRASTDSVVGMLSLGAGEGAIVDVISRGTDADAAAEAIRDVLLTHSQREDRRPPAPSIAMMDEAVPRRGTITGVCASPGIVVGRLVRWDKVEIEPNEEATRMPALERAELDRAVADVDDDLRRAVADASTRGASDEAAIFEVHRALLEDTELLTATCAMIDVGKSAAFAWRQAINDSAIRITLLSDTLLAERAGDLRDVGKRVSRALGVKMTSVSDFPIDTVLVTEEFTPSDISALDLGRVNAILMSGGGATSHASIIARQYGLPALVAMGDQLLALADGSRVVVDATRGCLNFDPSELEVEAAHADQSRNAAIHAKNLEDATSVARTRDGKIVEVAANIATAEDAMTAVINGADGVGLLRTELMFIDREFAPSVAEHVAAYQEIVEVLGGRSVIIRTIDVGADKDVRFLTLPHEPNPALGMRGVRVAKIHPELLDGQLRALLTVHPLGAVRILLPMISEVDELRGIRARIDEIAKEIGSSSRIEVGVMIEVPSAALLAGALSVHADFLSVGTNDLTQYTLAMDRCLPALSSRADALHPAVLRLIAMTVEGARASGRWVGVCGSMAGDLAAVPILVGLGITELSVDARSIPDVKARVRTLSFEQCQTEAKNMLDLDSSGAVRTRSHALWPSV